MAHVQKFSFCPKPTRFRLKCLSERLQEPRIEAPPPAAARVQYHPRRALFVQRWNEEIEVVFHSVRLWDRKVIQWGKTLMGIDKN